MPRSLADRLRAWARRSLSLNDPALRGLFQDTRTDSGMTVTEHTGLRLASVWACVRVISEDIATVPLILYRRLPTGGKERAIDRRLYRLLHDEPNPEMSSVVFRETLQAHVLTWGNGYAEIERNALGEPVALWPVPPDRVTPDRRTNRLVYRVGLPEGGEVILEPSEILHVPGLGFDGIRGYSPIRMQAQAIGLGMAAEEFGARFFGQGTNMGGFVKHPGALSDTAYERLQADLNTRQGVARSHLWMVLEEGMDVERITIPPDEAQYVETQKLNVTQIARIYRVPPPKIGDYERATYSNVEQAAIDYAVSTLRPWMVRWEQELNRKLIPPLERRQFFFEHLIDGLLRGDAAARSAALQTQFQNGALTIDEWREIENRNPVPDGLGKVHFVLTNMLPVEQLLEAPPEDPPPPTQPDEPPPALKDQDDRSAAAAVFASVLGDTLGRMARREAKAIARRARRVPDTAALLDWVRTFYADHRAIVQDAIFPAVQAYLRDDAAATATAADLATRYVEQQIQSLQAVIAQSGLDTWPAADGATRFVTQVLGQPGDGHAQ